MRGSRREIARPVLDAPRARAVALDLLARKPWTRRDLARRLRRRGAPADVAGAVVADLETRGYVNDGAFAAAWAESRARGRGFGRERLRQELLARGIARPLAEAAIARAFEETDELARAQLAATRRLAALRGAPDRTIRRLHDYLRRRGYPGEVVRQVLLAVRHQVRPDGSGGVASPQDGGRPPIGKPERPASTHPQEES
jgi:regulatory protein